jgi:hypothetical protein
MALQLMKINHLAWRYAGGWRSSLKAAVAENGVTARFSFSCWRPALENQRSRNGETGVWRKCNIMAWQPSGGAQLLMAYGGGS